MADLNQRFVTYVASVRATWEGLHPGTTLDSATLVMKDQPNVRNSDSGSKKDVNTSYYLVIP